MARVLRERMEGRTAYAIARDLNEDPVPTAQGARPVASYRPGAADAGRRLLMTTIADCAALNSDGYAPDPTRKLVTRNPTAQGVGPQWEQSIEHA
jgi:hypothetical protein